MVHASVDVQAREAQFYETGAEIYATLSAEQAAEFEANLELQHPDGYTWEQAYLLLRQYA
jgi:hypothetical protein